MDEIADLRRRLQREGKLNLSVKVTPRSSRTRIAGTMDDGSLKVTVAAVPDKGKANQELCDFLAREFGVPKSAITIQSGHTATRKRLLIVKTSVAGS